MNLASLLQDSFGESLQDSIASSAGVQKQDVSSVMKMALPIVTAALAKNAMSTDGAESLNSALEKDHDGSIVENPDQKTLENHVPEGNGILAHVLGSKRESMEQKISEMTGVDKSKVAMILAMLAPVVMGMLGKEKKESGLDVSGLGAFLSQSAGSLTKDLDAGDIVSSMLDKDGDGSMMDDMADMGMKALGNMFKK